MSAPSLAEEVCLIDDDPSVLRSMRNLLVADGLKVRPFNRPEEFLAHAANNQVAVVITDIWMEGVTGLEILARMCALNPRPQVIVITGREDLAAQATALAIGPVAFFMKPFNDEKFLAAVHQALNA
jgi:FixJ family two-component response regulator